MVFSSIIFLFAFLPAILLLYSVTPSRLKNIVLLVGSLFFYSWGEPKNVFIMIVSIVVNWNTALLIHKFRDKASLSNLFFILAIIFNLGLLFYFKYTDFLIQNINLFFQSKIDIPNIALPIGISFFTFQILSYIIDVKRNIVPVQRNPFNLGLYISFFPQLIAGPIVRYIDISNQIQMRTISAQKFSEGCIRFMAGFSKKVLIADQLAPYVDKIFALHGVSAPCAWLGITAYALQIYFDFSGYSDMAIGLGKMFGFDFLENFNYPYIAKSIKDFWRRWHISLSQWFRDYVYIPLGGNKVGCMRLIVNLLVVWSLTGFWHGASWNFIIWGLYYFVFLVMERFFLGRLLEKLPSSIQHLYAVVVILFGWIFFRETGLCYSMEYIQNLFIVNDNSWVDFVYIIDRKFLFCFLIGLLFSMPIVSVIRQKNKKTIEIAYCGLVFIVFIIAIAFLLGTNFSPFLYFRF